MKYVLVPLIEVWKNHLPVLSVTMWLLVLTATTVLSIIDLPPVSFGSDERS